MLLGLGGVGEGKGEDRGSNVPSIGKLWEQAMEFSSSKIITIIVNI